MGYTKNIEMQFEKVGKRTKLVGYIGELRDGETLIHSAVYSTYSEAEIALDALAYELLTDLAEQGLIDDLPPFDPSTCCFCHKPHASQSCPEMRALLFAPATIPTRTEMITELEGMGVPDDVDLTRYTDDEIVSTYRTILDVEFAPIGFEV